jgi:hypothetical protein
VGHALRTIEVRDDLLGLALRSGVPSREQIVVQHVVEVRLVG